MSALLWLRANWKLVAVIATISAAFFAGWEANGNRIQAQAAAALEAEREELLAVIRKNQRDHELQLEREIHRAQRVSAQLARIESVNRELQERIASADLSSRVTVIDASGEAQDCPDPTASRIFWRIFNDR